MGVAATSRRKRAALAVVGLGGLALLLSACTISATPTTIPGGTSTGQVLPTITVTFNGTGPFPEPTFPFSTNMDIRFVIETGHGSVALTTGSSITSQTTGTVSDTGPCTLDIPATEVVCPTVSEGAGAGTITVSGIKVNSTRALGRLVAVVSTEHTDVTRSATVAEYTPATPTTPTTQQQGTPTPHGTTAPVPLPVIVSPPTFHSAPSAAFVVGRPDGTWVRVQGTAVLSLIGAPKWLTISPHAGYLHGTPPPTSAGTYTFTILASTDPHTKRLHGSDNLTAKQSFTLKVVKI